MRGLPVYSAVRGCLSELAYRVVVSCRRGRRRYLEARKAGGLKTLPYGPPGLLLSATKQDLRWFVDRVFLRVLRLSFRIPGGLFAGCC